MADHPIDTSRKAIDDCMFRGSPGWHNILLRSVADERDAARAEIEMLREAIRHTDDILAGCGFVDELGARRVLRIALSSGGGQQ